MGINYYIGEEYKYYNSNKTFTLKTVQGYKFIFECGHWCTDNVFIDLIRIKTNKFVYDGMQLQLF